MPQAVYIIWAVLLVVVVLSLPVVVILLHRTLRASRNIARYFEEMKIAGLGIARNTGNIKALEETIQTASTILSVAGDIDKHSNTIKTTLAARADELSSDRHRN
ncbi:MAG: hypothetical protein ACE5IY_14970 [bacterium]